MNKELFGRKSEKRAGDDADADAQQLSLEGLVVHESVTEEAQQQTFITVKPHQRRRKHPGRNAIPADLPVNRQVLEPPEDEKRCSCCGREKVKIDETIRREIERIPARYVVNEYVRPKYACKHCKDTVTAVEPPLTSLIPRCLAGPQLLLFVVSSKYRYHLPLYRIQRQIYHESRVWFTRSTMVGWIRALCVPLERIYRAMIAEVKSGLYIHGDESLLKQVGGTTGSGSKTCWMWVYRGGPQARVAVFDYTQTRGGEAPRKFLKGSPAGTYLMIDGYSGYNAAIQQHDLVGMICMVHVRRQFVEAADVGSERPYAQKIIRMIGRLYRIEKLATTGDYTPDKRKNMRQRLSAAILNTIKIALQNPGFTVLPSSRIGQAINYMLNHWTQVCRYLEDGTLPIDNNPDEQIIRLLAIGRKNWMFTGSEEGGKRMAFLYSVSVTCQINGIALEEYLPDALMRAAIRPDEDNLADLTPLQWLKAKHNGTLPPLNAESYPSVG